VDNRFLDISNPNPLTSINCLSAELFQRLLENIGEIETA
jgi:hypothetical protein